MYTKSHWLRKGFTPKPFTHGKAKMLIVSNGMYFLNEIKKLIKDVGGEGNDRE